MPAKSDLIADVYQATATPWLVDVPEMGFLMIDGHGDPNTSSDYQEAVQAHLRAVVRAEVPDQAGGL